VASYRLQLRPGFGFAEAAALVDDLADLGVSHLYLSPILDAVPGSEHGYDVADPTRIRDELGGAEGFAQLAAAARRRGLGILLDIVPNHMAADPRVNAWWRDVLAKGPASRFAGYFDIDWEPDDPDLRGRVLVPILGEPLSAVLERGELHVVGEGDSLELGYYAHRLPLSPGSHTLVAGAGRDGEALPLADMARLLEMQHYRLSDWREAASRINYRRFFSIAALVGVRVEDDGVFDATHAAVLQLVERGDVAALRVDHVDGLRDPAGYLERLRGRTGDAWLVVEKILAPGERRPAAWPVDGTTGYEFGGLVTRLFSDDAGVEALRTLHRELTGEGGDVADTVRAARLQVLRGELAADVERLVRLLRGVARSEGMGSRWSHAEGRDALVEVLAAMPVYRTYVDPTSGAATSWDVEVIAGALAAARQARSDLDGDLLGLLRRALGEPALLAHSQALELAARFQQTSPAAMAKGVEDTAFYRLGAALWLDEVGNAPELGAASVADFHAFCAEIQARSPGTLLATSTHDSKRSEDVRARLGVLSEMPERWSEAVRRWMSGNARHHRGSLPDPAAELFLYQTLVGAHPLSLERAQTTMLKAVREAKLRTSWADPDQAYEAALEEFIRGVLGDAEFLATLEEFVEPVARLGRRVSLAQTLLKLTAPGVPDIYQGTELWDDSLVDPDNRRPVDFELRRRMQGRLRDAAGTEAILAEEASGLPKLWLITTALRLRRQRPELFSAEGAYWPLAVEGPNAHRVVAFARGAEPGAVTVVPRLLAGLDAWGATTVELPPGPWRSLLGAGEAEGGRAGVAELLGPAGVALLAKVA
jgi:(1->4)-alpha-D-glucan 1-alpha-D-glucosylmutase